MIRSKQAFGKSARMFLAMGFALFAVFLGIPAQAQMTPQSYCANISGCEFLGIKGLMSGMVTEYASTIYTYPFFAVEYCRGNVYKTQIFSPYVGNGASLSFSGNGTTTGPGNSNNLNTTTVCADTTDFP